MKKLLLLLTLSGSVIANNENKYPDISYKGKTVKHLYSFQKGSCMTGPHLLAPTNNITYGDLFYVPNGTIIKNVGLIGSSFNKESQTGNNTIYKATGNAINYDYKKREPIFSTKNKSTYVEVDNIGCYYFYITK